MPANLQIRETETGLSVRVTEGRRVGAILINFAIAPLVLYLFLRTPSTSPVGRVLILGFAVFALSKSIFSVFRGTAVELLVTNLDLASTGHAPSGYKPFTLPRADICNLEFREAAGGGDGPELPMGLYVEYQGSMSWTSSTCMLPHIDRSQTDEVIEAIFSRFPDTGSLLPTRPSEPYLTTLNLNSPK